MDTEVHACKHEARFYEFELRCMLEWHLCMVTSYYHQLLMFILCSMIRGDQYLFMLVVISLQLFRAVLKIMRNRDFSLSRSSAQKAPINSPIVSFRITITCNNGTDFHMGSDLHFTSTLPAGMFPFIF